MVLLLEFYATNTKFPLNISPPNISPPKCTKCLQSQGLHSVFYGIWFERFYLQHGKGLNRTLMNDNSIHNLSVIGTLIGPSVYLSVFRYVHLSLYILKSVFLFLFMLKVEEHKGSRMISPNLKQGFYHRIKDVAIIVAI